MARLPSLHPHQAPAPLAPMLSSEAAIGPRSSISARALAMKSSWVRRNLAIPFQTPTPARASSIRHCSNGRLAAGSSEASWAQYSISAGFLPQAMSSKSGRG